MKSIMKAKIKLEVAFRNEKAQELYTEMANNHNVWEYGIDNNGKIYFSYHNGVTKRYTRAEFIKLAKEN